MERGALRVTERSLEVNTITKLGGRALFAMALCVMLASALLLGGTSASATGCPVGKFGHQLVRSPQGDCVDNTPPSAHEQQIISAKEHFARALAAFKSGAGSQRDVDAARAQLLKVTGDDAVSPGTGGVSPLYSSKSLNVPSYAQYTNYYCGPATAEDILGYLGPSTSQTYDTVTGAYDTMNGVNSHDQPILANSFWLATDEYGGTNWGGPYMPFTLNQWRGTYWYYAAASYTMTISSAFIDVDSDLINYHPIAENVLYSASTYLPPGFPAGTYLHWDVIFSDDTNFVVGIAQPYGNPRSAYYWEGWGNQWSAIYAGHGIVW